MTKYVLKRLVYMVIVFLLVSLLMYSIYNLIPTDPARAQLEPMKRRSSRRSMSSAIRCCASRWASTTR